MGHLYSMLSFQDSGIIREEGEGRLKETEMVDEYKETVLSGHYEAIAGINPYL